MADGARVRRRPERVALVVLTAAVMALSVGWAATTVLRPATPAVSTVARATAVVQTGSVGSSVSLSASASWTTRGTGVSRAAGIVTEIILHNGATMQPGDVVLTVDLHPVVVAAGSVPSFRDLAVGSKGADVRQLQQLLKDLGRFAGTPDGSFNAATAAAVRGWQESNGEASTGAVGQGDIVYVRSLPARGKIASDISVGSTLTGGDPAVEVLGTAPVFSLSVDEAQTRFLALGTEVDITAPDGKTTWKATVGGQEPSDSGTVKVALAPHPGETICNTTCNQVDTSTAASLPARVITTPTVTGLTVPTSAVSSSGVKTWLTLTSGRKVFVKVLATADGVSAVRGATSGTRVLLNGDR